MRRLAPSLIAAFGIALLAACSGGGYGFNSGGTTTPQTPTSILFENGAAGVNDFFLVPNGNAPLQVSAVAIKGTGSGSVVVPDTTFTWAAVYAPAGTTYLKGASPNGFGTCGAPPSPAFPINSLLVQAPPAAAYSRYPLYLGYSQLLAQPPPASGPVGSFPTYTGQASTIFVGPPMTPAAASPYAPTTIIAPAVGSNYCINVVARETISGLIGSLVVVVSQAP
jgi:hypothetical protein